MAEKVLIVDDDLETLRLVGLMLQRQGYQIVAANNGQQGIQMAHAELPDLIVLDVMMPDMDGYQVTRQLRKEADTQSIPIIMFTAKSQVDDKVAGYEAGVDDYLTKPVHPAELVAHIKSLMARGGRGRGGPAAPSAPRGYVLAVMAPKGGMGTSTLVLNLAIMLAQRSKTDVIAAELRPGHGSWSVELGMGGNYGLNNLLQAKLNEITPSRIEKELIKITYGPRILMTSNRMQDIELTANTAQMESILNILPTMAPLVILDIGACLLPNIDRVLGMVQEVLLVTEPYPHSITMTQLLINDLAERGFSKSKLLTTIIHNRVRADVQLSVTQVQDKLGQPIVQVIPPAPEQAYQASMRSVPLIMAQPDGLVAQQYARLAEMVAQKIKK